MKPLTSTFNDDYDDPLITVEGEEEAQEDDLWFLPGPLEEEPDDLPPGPRAEPPDTAVIEDWAKAEGVNAARLARVAGRLGALDDRLLRGPGGKSSGPSSSGPGRNQRSSSLASSSPSVVMRGSSKSSRKVDACGFMCAKY